MAWGGGAGGGPPGSDVTATGDYLLAYLDAALTVRWVNRAYAKVAERAPEALAGRNFFELHPSEENEAVFRRVLRTGEPFVARTLPLRLSGPTGSRMTRWDCVVSPVRNAGLLLILRDVTDRVALEREVDGGCLRATQ